MNNIWYSPKPEQIEFIDVKDVEQVQYFFTPFPLLKRKKSRMSGLKLLQTCWALGISVINGNINLSHSFLAVEIFLSNNFFTWVERT